MTTIARICEIATMKLDNYPGRGEWFLDYVLRSPRQAGIHLTAGYHAIKALTDVFPPDEMETWTVHEYFAGMGAQAWMVEELIGPEIHRVAEFSLAAVEHLKREMPHHVKVVLADAYDPTSTYPADLVIADFGDLTAWKTRAGEKHRELLDRIFAREPRAVVFTDIACRYLHLHKERYETLLGEGTCGSYPDYLRALLARLESLYGYRPIAGYWDRWSTVMTLVPDHLAPAGWELESTPSSPVGLELL